MRIIKLLLIFLFASPLAAQSLDRALNENAALRVNAQSEQKQNTPLSSLGERDQVQAITVTRLPDIKLNEEILTKTVLTYEMPGNITESNKWFLVGDTDRALEELSNYKDDARAQAEIALINLQRRDYKKAQNALNTTLKLEPQEPIYNLLQIWLYAAQNKVKEAQKTYDKMLFLTSDFEYLASGKLALAQAYFNKKDFKEAGTILQDIYSNDPYKISHAVYLIARIYFANGNKKAAQTLFEQALEHDDSNYMPQLYLARTQYKLKQYIPSWQSYASLFILDGKNKEAKKYLAKLSKHIKGDAEDYLFYSRLNEMFIKDAKPNESAPLKIGLYSAPNGMLTNITGFTFTTSSPYTIKDDKRGFVLKADAFVAKNIIFDKKDKGVHIQNKWGTYDFSTKNPFIIELEDKKLSMIIKDAKADNIFATNLGDKELIGSLLVIPTENGMQLVNITSVEETVAPLLTTALHGVRDQAILETMAIATRTRLYNIIGLTADLDFNIPDNVSDFNFGGNNMVSFLARKTAEATKNQVLLTGEGELALAKIYKACGTVTE
ncbi:MAG: tetratricopeptide repeat protein, partial [Elusimicrobiaceae bacterium]|nr:tetratricopeptide repeat protein [Elusimicrobiaceae bacterium]